MHRVYERARRRLAQQPRLFAVALAALGLACILFAAVFTLRLVTITDDQGARHTLLTASRQPEEIIRLVGMQTDRNDEIVHTVESVFQENIHIRRAFPVAVTADGLTHSAEFLDGDVADLLAATGIELGPDDLVSPSLATPLTENINVQVQRVRYEELSIREEVAPELVSTYEQRLQAEGTAFLPSRNGMYDAQYRHTYIDGELADVQVLALAPVIQPRDPGSTELIPGVPYSTIEGFDGITMGPDGLPTNYTRLIEGADTTAYSSNGGQGSSGLGLYCGTVAVNPHNIPYGTRLFITSADGQWVYGFAIATDTGTSLMNGNLDIDLYFETNAECLAFGRRPMNVYVLD